MSAALAQSDRNTSTSSLGNLATAATLAKLPHTEFGNSRGLPLTAQLRPLLPDGILRRGICVAVSGKAGRTSLLLQLLAGPVASGSWAVIIGFPALGVEAANEFGISLDRLALVPDPGPAWLEVTAALLDAVDLVVLRPPANCRPSDARRLLARARGQHSTLVLIDDHFPTPGTSDSHPTSQPVSPSWPQSPDITLEASECNWSGLGTGHGSLRHCSISVTAGGRRLTSPPRRTQLHTGRRLPVGEQLCVDEQLCVGEQLRVGEDDGAAEIAIDRTSRRRLVSVTN